MSVTELLDWAGRFFLVFCRISGFFMTLPITSDWIPTRVRLALALAFSVPAVLQLSLPVQFQPLQEGLSLPAVLMLTSEFIIGATLAFTLLLYFSLFSLAGHLSGLQMVLGLAELNNPSGNAGITIIAQLFQLVSLMLFFLVNGHLVVFSVLIESVNSFPPGHFPEMLDRLPILAGLFGWMLSSGFLIALPVVSCLLVVNLGFGILSRFAPQLNLFTLGFPLMILAGMAILSLTVDRLTFGFEHLTLYALAHLRSLVQL